MSAGADFIAAAPGIILDHSGFDLPKGFLWADGSAVSRATYSRLFATLTRSATGTTSNASAVITGVSFDFTALQASVVGMPISGPNIPAGAVVNSVTSNSVTMSANATGPGAITLVIAPHGVGDGSTTFNVPDMRGRVVAGRDNMGGTIASRMTAASGLLGTQLGKAAGAETHTLTGAQIPSHNHPVYLNDPGHSHNTTAIYFTGSNNISGGSTANLNIQALGSTSAATGITVRDATGGGGTANQTAANAGGGSAHPNVQPTMILNKIVKT